MPIADSKPVVKPQTPDEIISSVAPDTPAPQLHTKPYLGVVADSEYQPLQKFALYAEGMRWQVDYYRQILGEDSEPAAFQYDRESVYQQYQRIRNFILKVADGFSFSYDMEKGEHSSTGTAIVIPTFKPNYGDLIVAPIGDGRLAYINVKTVEQPTPYRDSVYRIEYEVMGYVTPDISRKLAEKTVLTSIFVEDFLRTGQNPLVVEEAFDTLQSMEKMQRTLASRYLKDFYSDGFQTLLVPHQNFSTYDYWTTKAFMAIVEQDLIPANKRIELINCNNSSEMRRETVWDALLNLDEERLYGVVDKAMVIRTLEYDNQPVFGGIRYSGIHQLLYPVKPADPADRIGGVNAFSRGWDILYGENLHWSLDAPWGVPGDLSYELRNSYLNGLTELPPTQVIIPDIHPVGIDRWYLFSEYFYRNDLVNQSRLELMARQILRNEPIDTKELMRLCKESVGWGAVERYYYIPVLMILLKASVGAF